MVIVYLEVKTERLHFFYFICNFEVSLKLLEIATLCLIDADIGLDLVIILGHEVLVSFEKV